MIVLFKDISKTLIYKIREIPTNSVKWLLLNSSPKGLVNTLLHCNIRKSVIYSWGQSSSSSSISSLLNIISENAGNDLNNEANIDTSKTESCLSSESKRNKTKQDYWSDQQLES